MSKEHAIETVRKIFHGTTDDSISLRDIFIKFERQEYDLDKNKAWFSNILSNVKKHNLLTPVYATRRGKHTLDRVKLTLEAKTILGWYANGTLTQNVGAGANALLSPTVVLTPSPTVVQPEAPEETDLKSKINGLIEEFNRKNPDVIGKFVVDLK